VLLLCAVLFAGLLFVRPLSAFTTDEGAGILQARQVQDGWKWRIASPPPELDPTGEASLLMRSDDGSRGRAFYSKHPLYPVLLAGVDALGKRPGLFFLSIFGTASSSVVAALIARRLRPDLDRATLWITGLASPLFFYAYVVVGHSLLAALTGLVVLLALGAGRMKGTVRAGLLFLCCAIAAALRTEGAFVGPALAVGLLASGWLESRSIASRARPALTVMAGAVTGAVLDRLAARAVIGDPLPTESGNPDGFFASRWDGLIHSWFSGSMDGIPSDVLLVGATSLLIVAAVLAARPAKSGMASALVSAAAALYVTRTVADQFTIIPGLVLTAPVGVVGLVALRSRWRQSEDTRVLVLTSLFFVAAVALTQYAGGGGLEWGGRYFSAVLPLLSPLVVLALAHLLPALGRWRFVTVAALTVGTACMSVTSLSILNRAHMITTELEQLAENVTRDHPNAVMVWTQPLFPQVVWDGVDVERWLIPPEGGLAATVERLKKAGVEEAVLVSGSEVIERPLFEGTFPVVEARRARHTPEVFLIGRARAQ